MTDAQLTREELEKKARDASDLADLKQHADKLILGFENSSPNDAKRALWELIQNARDLSKDAIIEVSLKENEFVFTHHGATFTPNTLLCLVKQVSSKERKKKEQKADDDEVKEVGQYGTGFITTHSLGKRFIIDGTIELQPSEYVIIKDFLIDRVAEEESLLSRKLLDQQNEIFKMVREGTITGVPLPTTFRYQFDHKNERDNAEVTLSATTEAMIPFVMAMNSSISSISISHHQKNAGHPVSFRRVDSGTVEALSFVSIQKDDAPPMIIYFLQVDKELDLKIMLPLSAPTTAVEPSSSLSRLFLYFPLIGTESWGINFVIHCGLFNPQEKRDGIHISSDNLQNKEKEKNNREILTKASDAIFALMEKNAAAISDPIYLANISFSTLTGNSFHDTFFKELKAKWVTKFRTYALVETADGRKQPAECYFISEEFIQDPDYHRANYDLISFFWKTIPQFNLSEKWTNTIRQWEDGNTNWITIEQLCKNIQKCAVGEIDNKLLLPFYTYLLKTGGHRYFIDYRLLPTLSKTFAVRTNLFKPTSLHPLFLEMSASFAPTVLQHLVLDNFIQGHDFKEYTRNDLSKQLNPAIREKAGKLKADNLLGDAERDLLMRFSNSFASLDNKGARGELLKVILAFYELRYEPVEIPNLGEDKIDYSAAVEALIKNIIWDFVARSQKDKEWTKTNLSSIKDLLVVVTNNKEYLEIVGNLPVFVNQNYALIGKEKALIQDGIPDDLKTLYFDIFKKDVNDELLHDDFVAFLKDGKLKEGGQLALEINKFITDHGAIEAINEHPDSKIIMRIIQRISDANKETSTVWSKLFQGISAAKATIVMATIIKEERKENLFSIITLEDDNKIALLGELAKDKDMDVIIQYGRLALYDEQNRKVDFDIKHTIGKHIENLLRQKIDKLLNSADISVQVLDEQKGKDVIIKKGETVLYYLEIKSRWRAEYSIRMSRLQAETSAKNRDNYALIGVNMVGYYPENADRHAPKEVALIEDRIVVLEKIGGTVGPLIEKTMNILKQDEEIHLGPDYAIVVPQPVFKNEGINFHQFIENLSAAIEKKIKNN